MNEQTKQLNRQDLIALVFCVAFILFASWYRSSHSIFWSDEIMGWHALRADSWRNLFRIWYGGVDSSGIFFYLFGRPWLSLFGPTTNSLRLFSAMGVAVSFVLTWLCARRFSSFSVVAISIPFVFLLNRTVFWQLANGRTYGIVLVGTALTSYAMIRTDPEEQDGNGVWPLILTFAGFLLLAGSHILGILYWGVFFLGFAARDGWFRVFRPKLYVAALAGLIPIPFSVRNIIATTSLGRTSSWTGRPALKDLFRGFECYSSATGLVIVCALFLYIAIFYWRRRSADQKVLPPYRGSTSLYFLIGIFGLLTLIMFAVSRITTSIFVDRYLLPVAIGDALLLFVLIDLSWRALAPRRATRVVIVTACGLLFAALYLYDLRSVTPYPLRDYTKALLAEMPFREPVVVTQYLPFTEMSFYHSPEEEILAPVDPAIQLDPRDGPAAPIELYMLKNLKEYGFNSGQILSTPELLRGKDHFLVVSRDRSTLWAQRYILSNRAYHVTELPEINDQSFTLRVWQVDSVR